MKVLLAAVNAKYIHGIFENGQWGGCNQAYLFDNGKIGVIGHLSDKIYDEKGNEIKTRVYGKVFDVVEEKKQIGIMWKEKFKTFSSFAPAVHFENVRTGTKYFSNQITGKLERI